MRVVIFALNMVYLVRQMTIVTVYVSGSDWYMVLAARAVQSSRDSWQSRVLLSRSRRLPDWCRYRQGHYWT